MEGLIIILWKSNVLLVATKGQPLALAQLEVEIPKVVAHHKPQLAKL